MAAKPATRRVPRPPAVSSPVAPVAAAGGATPPPPPILPPPPPVAQAPAAPALYWGIAEGSDEAVQFHKEVVEAIQSGRATEQELKVFAKMDWDRLVPNADPPAQRAIMRAIEETFPIFRPEQTMQEQDKSFFEELRSAPVSKGEHRNILAGINNQDNKYSDLAKKVLTELSDPKKQPELAEELNRANRQSSAKERESLIKNEATNRAAAQKTADEAAGFTKGQGNELVYKGPEPAKPYDLKFTQYAKLSPVEKVRAALQRNTDPFVEKYIPKVKRAFDAAVSPDFLTRSRPVYEQPAQLNLGQSPEYIPQNWNPQVKNLGDVRNVANHIKANPETVLRPNANFRTGRKTVGGVLAAPYLYKAYEDAVTNTGSATIGKDLVNSAMSVGFPSWQQVGEAGVAGALASKLQPRLAARLIGGYYAGQGAYDNYDAYRAQRDAEEAAKPTTGWLGRVGNGLQDATVYAGSGHWIGDYGQHVPVVGQYLKDYNRSLMGAIGAGLFTVAPGGVGEAASGIAGGSYLSNPLVERYYAGGSRNSLGLNTKVDDTFRNYMVQEAVNRANIDAKNPEKKGHSYQEILQYFLKKAFNQMTSTDTRQEVNGQSMDPNLASSYIRNYLQTNQDIFDKDVNIREVMRNVYQPQLREDLSSDFGPGMRRVADYTYTLPPPPQVSPEGTSVATATTR